MPVTYEPIATTTLGTAASSVTFSSIPATYTDLICIVNAQLVSGATSTNLIGFLNNDTGNNYSWTRLFGDGSSAASDRASNYGSMILAAAGFLSAANPTNYIIQINNYANTTTNKTVLNRANLGSNGTDVIVNLWRNTAAITTLKLQTQISNNMIAGSTFTLYGIKSA
jgi:hypothetical protein